MIFGQAEPVAQLSAMAGDHVLVERLAVGTRLFRAIQHGDLLHALGNRRQQGGLVQGAEEVDLDQADFLARGR